MRRIDKSTITVGDFNCPLSTIDGTSRQKVSNNLKTFNNTINQLAQDSNIDHCNQQQQNTYSYQVHMKHLPR